ncbi:MAG: SulP family inorganic anion transporter [Nitrospira sp.]|nr:SulP family inorganic anion transporter [Nitrospira sp.]MDD9859631.1 SulP family inorganic anion transporter [Nitrospira sp.]
MTWIRRTWKADLLSGFLVFLIALPLCLGIALACGYPAIAGIFTAIIGGLLSTFFSNSELTIKGPAAGLIVIAIGCVTEFGYTGGSDPDADFQAYRLALGVGVAAGLVQILFGVFRAGILGEFFPTTVIHGLLAAIGVIIIAKQFPIVMGASSEGSPVDLLIQIPMFIMNMNPIIGLIGIVSLIIMFGYPLITSPVVKMIPAPMVVLCVAVPMGLYWDIGQEGTYTFNQQVHALGEQFLVSIPLNMVGAMTFPDFSGLLTMVGVKYVIMFALIGSLESLLSAKAIDQIDPWKRKTNLDRDTLAVGVGNTVSALVGGLPMISEIVRSKANIDNGARTRFANMFHGLFLLIFVALAPALVNQLPQAALGAMLVFTGFRLASPREFVHMYRLGKDQCLIFVSTIVGVLATDLLTGIAIGILVKFILHVINGAPLRSLYKLNAEVTQEDDHSATIVVRDSAIFSTWIPLRKHLHRLLQDSKRVTLNLSATRLVDHTVMSKLEEWKTEFATQDSELSVTGLEQHRPLSDSPVAVHTRPDT